MPSTTHLDEALTDAKQQPLHGLYERAASFLSDPVGPRLILSRSLGYASVGQEVEGSYYRLTTDFSTGSDALHQKPLTTLFVRGLVAVDLVPGTATIDDGDGRLLADSTVGTRLWRLTPAYVGYAAMGYDTVYGPRIEDLAAMDVMWQRFNSTSRTYSEPVLPHKTFHHRLEGQNLEKAMRITSALLDALQA